MEKSGREALAEEELTGWGGEGQSDNYLITEDSAPAAPGVLASGDARFHAAFPIGHVCSVRTFEQLVTPDDLAVMRVSYLFARSCSRLSSCAGANWTIMWCAHLRPEANSPPVVRHNARLPGGD